MTTEEKSQHKSYIATDVQHSQVVQGEDIRITGQLDFGNQGILNDPPMLLKALSDFINSTVEISDADKQQAQGYIKELSAILESTSRVEDKQKGRFLVNTIKGIIAEVNNVKPIFDILNAIKTLLL